MARSQTLHGHPPPLPRAPAPKLQSSRLARLVSRRDKKEHTEPAVLVVGADEALLPALEAALARHRVFVEAVPVDSVVDAAVAAAPDLILLAREPARDC